MDPFGFEPKTLKAFSCNIMKLNILAVLVALAPCLLSAKKSKKGGGGKYFQRIASVPVCSQVDPACNDDTATAAEIVSATADGMTLVYTDSPMGVLGFVNITDSANPEALGYIDVGGEPTSVAVCGAYAIVVVNTSPSYVEPRGVFHVVRISDRTVVRTDSLPGQPDSISTSPDCKMAAVAVENERDEDLGDGEIPQMPPGSVVVMNITAADPMDWTTTEVDVTGLANVYENSDPEPEYVSINSDYIAAVTLQENNAVVLIDTLTAQVIASYDAGTVNLTQVDALEDDTISQSESLQEVPREPDGIAWLNADHYVTANEGDMAGGSRGFSIFTKDGNLVYDSGNELEHIAAMIGHYPEGRSESKGIEPENVAYGKYAGKKLLFVNSERSSVVFVYDVNNPAKPKFLQVLPAGLGPEGAFAIPQRDLLIVASEEDSREDGFRSVINIYCKGFARPSYPMIVSADRADGTPIPFAALSGLAAAVKGNTLFSIEDSFFRMNRVFVIDSKASPPRIIAEHRITDANGVFADFVESAGLADADIINDDGTVNIDPEGIAVSDLGGFWLVSEGSGTIGDEDNPFETPNLLFKLNSTAAIEEVITLPPEVSDMQVRYGFEGVAEDGELVVVAFQRAWGDENNPRIGIYNTTAESWDFLFYPLDEVESQNGGWVGLSDIAPVGDSTFYVLERDNQAGPDAVIKRIYSINLDMTLDEMPDTLNKTLLFDLYDTLAHATNGPIVEKVEGLTVDSHGNVWINSDNDGVDDNNGETIMLNIGKL